MFGNSFGFAQVGIYSFALNGTTLAFSKKGSGVNDILNPCIEKFMQNKGDPKYPTYEGLVVSSANERVKELGYTSGSSFEPKTQAEAGFSTCSNGYCPCGVQAYDKSQGTDDTFYYRVGLSG